MNSVFFYFTWLAAWILFSQKSAIRFLLFELRSSRIGTDWNAEGPCSNTDGGGSYEMFWNTDGGVSYAEFGVILFCVTDIGDEYVNAFCRHKMFSSGEEILFFARRHVSREHWLLHRLPDRRPTEIFEARDATRPSSSSVSLPFWGRVSSELCLLV